MIASGRHTWQYVALLILPTFGYFFSDILVMPSGIDPWLYYAYATEFSSLIHRFGWTYYAARLSWIGFQALFYHTLSPAVAHFIVGLIVSFVGSLSVYSITLRYFGRPAAFVTGLALAANPLFVTASFWSYPNGAVISTSLLSIAAFIKGHDEERDSYLLLAGFAAAIAVLAQIVALIIIPPALLLILIYHHRPSPSALRDLIVVIGSSVATIFLFCVGTKIFFGEFWFFAVTLRTSEWIVSGGWHEWVRPFSTWLPTATAVAMPIATFLLSLGAMALKRPRDPNFETGRWIVVYNVYVLVIYGVFDFVFHAGRTQHLEYFGYLLVPMYLLLGKCMGYLFDDLNGRWGSYVYAAVILSQLVPMVLMKEIRLVSVSATWIFLSFVLATVVYSFVFAQKSSALGKVVTSMLLLLFLSVAAAADQRTPLMKASKKTDYFMTVVAAQKFLKDSIRPDRSILFWYDSAAQDGDVYMGINSLYLWGYARLNGHMPELPANDLSKINAATSVIVLFSSTSEAAGAVKVLSENCLSPNISARAGVGGRKIGIWVVDVSNRNSSCGAMQSFGRRRE